MGICRLFSLRLWVVLLGCWGEFDAHPEPVRLSVKDVRMASTPQARAQLQYLASCALGPDVVLTATQDGIAYEFPGDMGLAPQWVARALTPVEERWVSACMLARTNRDGISVVISMRPAFSSPVEGLHVSPEEAEQFTLEEGTFFGNLFAVQPTSYVCGPAHPQAQRAFLLAGRRVCALQASRPAPDGLTECGMVHVGACTPLAFQRDGIEYREAISVYLSSRPPAGSTQP